MPNPERLTPKDLVVGGRYIHVNGIFIRQIDALEGDTVVYHDQYAHGQCGRSSFLKACPSMASTEQAAQAEEELARIARGASESEFTLRDEANALTAIAFRNGFLEDLHAGKFSPVLNEPGYSRITDEEMKRLMIEASAKLAELLRLKREDPAKYEIFNRDYQRRYCRSWQR